MNDYEKNYEKAINNDEREIAFNLSIDFLNMENHTPNFIQEKHKILNRAINDSRLYIDKLINSNNFNKAEEFCFKAKDKLQDSKTIKPYPQQVGEIENFFETFHYRIIDREYIFNAKNKIEEIEKKSESKIYEILTIFVTIIAVIFSFVSGGNVKILHFKLPTFVVLAITIVFSWWIIKTINSKK